ERQLLDEGHVRLAELEQGAHLGGDAVGRAAGPFCIDHHDMARHRAGAEEVEIAQGQAEALPGATDENQRVRHQLLLSTRWCDMNQHSSTSAADATNVALTGIDDRSIRNDRPWSLSCHRSIWSASALSLAGASSLRMTLVISSDGSFSTPGSIGRDRPTMVANATQAGSSANARICQRGRRMIGTR